MPKKSLYNDDLAHIHIDGYGFHWRQAAPAVLKRLRDAGIKSGTVIDLGCGGGEWLAYLSQRGYKTVGVDASSAMIQAARQTATNATLIHGSFADAALPPCDAVTSLGEPLNYLDSASSFKRTLNSVFQSLRSGGLFVFDVREAASKPVETRVSARVGDDWACIATIDETAATGPRNRDHTSLTRRITTFRRIGAAYRRSEEVHQLRLFSRAQMTQWLRDLGFRVRTFRSYGAYRLAPRQIIFVARKP